MFDDYLSGINASRVIRERVDYLYSLLSKVIDPSQMPFVFVSNVLDEQGQPQWKSLWFYGPGVCSEFKNFQFETNFDWCPMVDILHWELKIENYELETADFSSRAQLHWRRVDVTGEMVAVGPNCEQVLHFLKTALRP